MKKIASVRTVCCLTITLVVGGLVNAGLPTAQASPYSSLVLSKSPVGYWRLGESSLPTAADETTPASNGTYTNMIGGDLGQPGLITGDSDTAASFNGSNAYVEIGTPSELYGAWTGMSGVAWISINNYPSGAGTILGQWANSVSQDRVLFFVNSSGRFGAGIGSGSGPTNESAVSTSTIGLDEKVMVAFTFENGTPGTYLIYLNGQSETISTVPTPINSINPSLTAAATRIGAQVTGVFRPFDGIIDEVALFDYVLTPADIQELYELGANGPVPAPEPGSLLLLGLGCVVLTRKKARIGNRIACLKSHKHR